MAVIAVRYVVVRLETLPHAALEDDPEECSSTLSPDQFTFGPNCTSTP
jgi:hypothetical protein